MKRAAIHTHIVVSPTRIYCSGSEFQGGHGVAKPSQLESARPRRALFLLLGVVDQSFQRPALLMCLETTLAHVVHDAPRERSSDEHYKLHLWQTALVAQRLVELRT